MERNLENRNICEFWIICKEKAPTTGKLHRHVYLILVKKLRINQVSALFGDL